MQAYKCYLLNGQGHPRGVRTFEAESDLDATRQALAIHREGGHPGIELWIAERRVLTYLQSTRGSVRQTLIG